MNKEPNNYLIELARQSRGYTQKDLVSFLPNVSQSSLSKIEKGLLRPTSENLADIAKLLNYPVPFFYGDHLKTPLSSIYFRKRTTVPQKLLDKIFADIKISLNAIDSLLSDVELKPYQIITFDLTDGWTTESLAIRLREMLRVPAGPIKNLINIIEEQGIIVYPYDSVVDKFDGLTAYTDAGYPVIVYNSNMPNDRIKFTITHELMHLVCHIPCSVEPWRDPESEANASTSEFLMPKSECAYELQNLSYNHLGMLKSYWGISKAAIIRRAKDIGAISQTSYQYLMIELGRRKERKVESGFVEVDEPQILKRVVELLKKELDYTSESLAEKLNLSINDYSRLFEPSLKNTPKLRFMKRAI